MYLELLRHLQRPGRNRAREVSAAGNAALIDSKPEEQLGRMFLRDSADKTETPAPGTFIGK